MAKRVYGKTTRELMREFAESFKADKSKLFTRKEIKEYFTEKFPKIKSGTIDAHIARLTINNPSRVHYSVQTNGQDDVFFQLPDRTLRAYDREKDPAPVYFRNDEEKSPVMITENIPDEQVASTEFAYEEDLQYYLKDNLHILEEDLKLYHDDDNEIQGVEYDAGDGRRIDILALDKHNNLVVIELKVSKAYDRVVGQLLRYMGWIKESLADEGQKVRGIIVARNISKDIKIACSQVSNVDLFEYKLSISVEKV